MNAYRIQWYFNEYLNNYACICILVQEKRIMYNNDNRTTFANPALCQGHRIIVYIMYINTIVQV